MLPSVMGLEKNVLIIQFDLLDNVGNGKCCFGRPFFLPGGPVLGPAGTGKSTWECPIGKILSGGTQICSRES